MKRELSVHTYGSTLPPVLPPTVRCAPPRALFFTPSGPRQSTGTTLAALLWEDKPQPQPQPHAQAQTQPQGLWDDRWGDDAVECRDAVTEHDAAAQLDARGATRPREQGPPPRPPYDTLAYPPHFAPCSPFVRGWPFELNCCVGG